MTTSSLKSPVTRITGAYIRDRGLREVIVTIHGSIVELRAKGLRQREVLDISSLYYQAVKQRVANEKRERMAARKAKRSAR